MVRIFRLIVDRSHFVIAVVGDFLRRFRLFGVARGVYRAASYSQHRYGRECRSARSVHRTLEVGQVTVVVFQITVVDDNEVGERVFFAFCGVVLRHKICREPAAEGMSEYGTAESVRRIFLPYVFDKRFGDENGTVINVIASKGMTSRNTSKKNPNATYAATDMATIAVENTAFLAVCALSEFRPDVRFSAFFIFATL